MKKRLLVALIVVVALTMVFATSALAGDSGRAGKSSTGHVYLYEKDASWDIVEDGAWGKMSYRVKRVGDDLIYKYVFNGHMLEVDEEYDLILYMDEWPGTGSIDLGTDVADMYGDVHFSGMFTIPHDSVFKPWLVLGDDFDGSEMVGWNPADYLFEHHVLPEPDWH